MGRVFVAYIICTTLTFLVSLTALYVYYYLSFYESPSGWASFGYLIPVVALGSLVGGVFVTILYEGFRPLDKEE